ncbi:unnamed protein product [Arctia plantaginis]|uniref:Uncharacterized protein n=1 Tax=Arctia plantaginis TaxID=874455 RepID=A0A8S0Z4W5_ARCPL|nr:unnamed protein product [Arctia plantaginis]
MCLNRWPQFTKCFRCLSLKAGVVLFSIFELLLSSAIFAHVELIVGDIDEEVVFVNCLKAIMMIRIISTFILISSWSGVVLKCNIDLFLQMYIYVTMTSTVLHFIYCITFFCFGFDTYLVKVIVQLILSLVAYAVIAYMLVIVNSFRMYIT